MAYIEEVSTNLLIDSDSVISVNIIVKTLKDGRFIGEESTIQKFRPGNTGYEEKFALVKDSIVTQVMIDQDNEISELTTERASLKSERDQLLIDKDLLVTEKSAVEAERNALIASKK